jgi:hypothetical protein
MGHLARTLNAMTGKKQFKREVKARMEVSGRSYTDQRRIVLAEREAEQVAREAEADADKAAGLVECYDTDETFLASFDGPAEHE